MDTPSISVSQSNPEKVALVAIAAGFLVWSAAFIHHSSFTGIDGQRHFCLFDDAMISMRYAWNLSHGAGLVWNAGERVEGYTNLLMTLVMSLATLIFDKSGAVLCIQIAGAGLMLGVACVTLRISDIVIQGVSDQRRSVVRALSFFCALAYYPLLYWTLMGMETGLLTLLLLLSVLYALRHAGGEDRASPFMVAGFMGLACLTRNDALIFAVLIWLYIALESSRRTAGRGGNHLLPAVGCFLLFVAGQAIFRRLYYGGWLPNTYTLKLAGMPLFSRIVNGAGFISPFLGEVAPILILACIELRSTFWKPKALLMSIFLSAVLYQVYVGGDPWNYWRIVSPAMPLLAILFIDALLAITAAAPSGQAGRFLRHPAALVLLTLSGLAYADWRFAPEISFQERPYQVLGNRENVNTAIALDRVTTDEASVGVFWGGAIPYFTGRRGVDFLGRCDPYVAQLRPDLSGRAGWDGMTSVPGHNKYNMNYSVAILRPTYVQRFEWGSQDLKEWARTHYATVYHHGVRLNLLKDSGAVLWDRINAP